MEQKRLKLKKEEEMLRYKVGCGQINRPEVIKSKLARNPVTGQGIECRDSYIFKKRELTFPRRNPITGEGIEMNTNFGARKKRQPNSESKT